MMDKVLLWIGIMLATGTCEAQGTHLDSMLSQMDASSVKFKSAQADFQWDFFERVVKSTSTQTGTIYFERVKSTTEMGARIEKPKLTILDYSKGSLEVFNPGEDTLIHIAAKKNQSQYESFLTLGFGGSGSELKKQWKVTDQGVDPIDGISCAKLDLVSLDQSVKNMFTHVTIWVDLSRDVLLKQMFYTPSDDVRTAYYKNIRFNAKVDAKPYEIKPDKATKRTER